MGSLAVLICSWSRWIFHITVSRRVINDEGEGHDITISIFLELFAIVFNLLPSYWLSVLSHWLALFETVNSGHNVPLDGLDRALLCLRWDLKTCLWDPDSAEIGFDNFSIEGNWINDIDFEFDSVILELTSELDFGIFVTAMITLKC